MLKESLIINLESMQETLGMIEVLLGKLGD